MPTLTEKFSNMWQQASDNFAANFEQKTVIDNSEDQRLKNRVLEEEENKVEAETGKHLDLTPGVGTEGFAAKVIDGIPIGGSVIRDFIFKGEHDRQVQTDETVKEIQKDHPDFQLDSPEVVSQKMKQKAQEIEERMKQVKEDSGIAGTVGSIAGQIAGSMTDPVNVGLTVATGPLSGIGKVALASVVLREGAINAGVEAAQQFGFIQEKRKELGLEHGTQKALESVAGAAVGGGVLGGALHLGIRAKDVISSLVSKFDETVPKPTKAQRAARANLVKAQEIHTQNPLTETNKFTSQEHQQRMDAVYQSVINEKAPPTFQSLPIDKKYNIKTPTYERMDVSQLDVDAKTFQYKADTNEQGVKLGEGGLVGVKQWDENAAGVLMVFEKKDGSRVVADGHQRAALAKRLKEEDPSHPTDAHVYVLKEKDGFKPDRIRNMAAARNIQQGTGTPIDAAKILRTNVEDLPPLPPQSRLVKDAKNLQKLSDDAFHAVVNEVVPANYGAMIGKLEPDASKHIALIDLLNREKPANLTQAESIIKDAQGSGYLDEVQEDLFGTEVLASTLFRERAQVLEKAISEIKRNKTLFNTLLEQENKIMQIEGNQLSTDANREIVSGANKLFTHINKLANLKGDISDALTNAAKEFKRTGDIGSATRRFVDDVKGSADRGFPSGDELGRTNGDIPNAEALQRNIEEIKPEEVLTGALETIDPKKNTIEIEGRELSLDDTISAGVKFNDVGEEQLEEVSIRKILDSLEENDKAVSVINTSKGNIDDLGDQLRAAGIPEDKVVEIEKLGQTIVRDLRSSGLTPAQVYRSAKETLKTALNAQKSSNITKTLKTINAQNAAKENVEAYMAQYGESPFSMVESLLSLVEYNRLAPYASFKNRYDVLRGQAHKMFRENLMKYETKAAGLYNPATGKIAGVVKVKNNTQNTLVDELYGVETGNQSAKELAREFQTTLDFLHNKATQIGIDMPKLSDYRLPNPAHDPQKMYDAGEKKWIDDIGNLLDWNKMTRPQSQTKINPADRRSILSDVYKTLSTDGKNKTKGKHSSLVDYLKDGRFLKFKDSKSYMDYNAKYGSGTPFDNMLNHIDKMSRRISLIDTFGPNPIATQKFIKKHILKRAADIDAKNAGTSKKRILPQVEAKIHRFDEMFQYGSQMGDLAESVPSKLVSNFKNLMVSSQLTMSTLSAVPSDLFFSSMAIHGKAFPSFKFLNLYLKQLNPLSNVDRSLAMRAEMTNETVEAQSNAASRWIGEVGGSEITRRLADTSMRLNLLSPHTKAAKNALALEFMGKFADDRLKPFNNLDTYTKRIFVRNNITPEEWDIFRKIPVHKQEGTLGTSEYLMPSQLREAKHVETKRANDIADKFMFMINNQKNIGVIDRTIRTSSLFLSTAAKGSIPATMAHLVSFLKSFPVTLHRQFMNEVRSFETPAGKTAYAAKMAAGTVMAGAVSQQLYNVANGRNPETMDRGEFWKDSASRGGAFLIFDPVVQNLNEFGKGAGSEFVGPGFSTISDITNLTVGNAVEYGQGSKKVVVERPQKVLTDIPEEDLKKVVDNHFEGKEVKYTKEEDGKVSLKVKGVSSQRVADVLAENFQDKYIKRKPLEGDELKDYEGTKLKIGENVAEIVEGDPKDTNALEEGVGLAKRLAPGFTGFYDKLVFDRLVWDQVQHMTDPDGTDDKWYKDAAERVKKSGQSYWWSKGEKKPLRFTDFSNMLKSTKEAQAATDFEFRQKGRPSKEESQNPEAAAQPTTGQAPTKTREERKAKQRHRTSSHHAQPSADKPKRKRGRPRKYPAASEGGQ